MKRLYTFIIILLVLVSTLPFAMAATYIIEHDGELDLLSRARSSRPASVTIDPIMTLDDEHDAVYDHERRYRYADVWDKDDYEDCIDDTEDEYDDGDIDRDEYLDELRDCNRRYGFRQRYGYGSGPLRSLEWFYEWKFNPKTFADRYCPPHLHRYPARDGPTWYEISLVHDCIANGVHHEYVSRPRYERASSLIHYTYEDYEADTPRTVLRPAYRRQDDNTRYTFTAYRAASGSSESRSTTYPEEVHWHPQTEPALQRTYRAAAYRDLREYCERTRATDGSMSAWCTKRAHLWR